MAMPRPRSFDALPENVDRFAPRQRVGAACDRLLSRSEHPGMPVLDEFGDTALMVGVVVRDQDGFEAQLQRFQPRHDRCGVARIDHGRPSVADQQPDVIVLECGNEQNFEHAGTIEPRSTDVNSRSR